MAGTSFGQNQQLRQNLRMIPEQIIAGEFLQLPQMDLAQRLQAEFEKNPALTLEEVGLCPRCGAPMNRTPCPSCGFKPSKEDDVPVVQAEDWETFRQHVHEGGENPEAFAAIAVHQSLEDDLLHQWALIANEDERPMGTYLIHHLNDEGYFTEPLFDIADRFKLSVPQIEAVLQKVQELDPPGIGARNLKECLLIQCRRYEGKSPFRSAAEKVIREGWDDLVAQRVDRLAKLFRVSQDDVKAVIGWIRKNLAPYPARAYREEWGHLTSRPEARVAPDVIIRHDDEDLIVEIVESRSFSLGIDPEYMRLSQRIKRRNVPLSPELEHVRRSIRDAQTIIDALAQRRKTLHVVMVAVAEEQQDYLLKGPNYLKPLNQKEIAQKVGIHESTISRALANKWVQIPSGDTVPTSQFFEDATAVKEVIRELVGREDPKSPLSDARIAQLLTDSGHKIARRTIAKYREALHIPSIEARKVRA